MLSTKAKGVGELTIEATTGCSLLTIQPGKHDREFMNGMYIPQTIDIHNKNVLAAFVFLMVTPGIKDKVLRLMPGVSSEYE